MREIKIEYILLEDNKFVNKEILTLDDIEQKNSNEFCYELLKENEKIIKRQYTGLKDKNGVEVYEGDLIKTKNSLYKVIYDKCCFWGIDVMGKYPIYQIKHYVLEDEIFKVIGNIYEHAHLLDNN